MTQLVTSDQFITGVLSQMVLHGNRELKLIDTIVDERFEALPEAHGGAVEK